jgi:hypothetical protein
MYNSDATGVLAQPGFNVLTDATQTLKRRRQVCGPAQLSDSLVMTPSHTSGLRQVEHLCVQGNRIIIKNGLVFNDVKVNIFR